ncbi:hypothetical protein [Algibacter sp. 2305UL17-15]|uniref:hypothetical protein n=1 Tax=Algibacter sp. 2305UL17-15 TaxID=3231268 RepID=UPI00345B288C
MKFIDYTNQWIKGELFEARLIVAFAFIIIVIALLFYYLGSTPSAKALVFPLLLVGILFLGIGGGMLYSNPKRSTEYAQLFGQNETEFIKTEKERVEKFSSWYPITRWIMAGLGVLGIGIFIFWETPIGRAIGIALILTMLATYVVDHFSEERANMYYQHIINH